MARPAAVLFDLDDTILNFQGTAGPAWERVTSRFASEYRGRPAAAVRDEIATVSAAWWSDPERHRRGRLDLHNTRCRNVAEALQRLGIADDGLAERIATAFAEARTHAVHPFAGALDTLRRFRDWGVKLGLVTNGDSDGQRAKIERFGLAGFFACILIEEEFGVGKPDERVFHQALGDLGTQPQQAWMVGDNLWWEIEPCHRLGLHTVWVDPYGTGLPADAPVPPHRTVGAIAELVAPGGPPPDPES